MVEDLAKRHELVGDLFEIPKTKEEWDEYRLSQEQIEFYRENGYLAGIRILDDTQIEALRHELSQLVDPEHPGNGLFYEYNSNESTDPSRILFHALGHWRITPGFHDLLWNPAFTMAAYQLLGGPVRFWHDQIFYKPANDGGVVAWHQDYSYWTRTVPLNHLTCWIGLDDSTKENGCVHYVPGSHKWDLLPITGLAGDMDAIKEVLTEDQFEKLLNPIPVELEKGCASFHHGLTIHGSFENNSPRPRRAAVVNAFLDGTKSDQDEPMLAGTEPIPVGSPMGGTFYPMLKETAY
ncbi:MAG: phytanoyl-CoA dioxygenase family protein [Candidatus Omnitrophica bacterium]|nr:phytanoyl-CoA dioxygenase family protein [Candidatus Omnitrophota bacterium]MCA9435478.1 phytanoyl-CoA dioxygenase family protein [Candidatus Omnitrophota bacterium]